MMPPVAALGSQAQLAQLQINIIDNYQKPAGFYFKAAQQLLNCPSAQVDIGLGAGQNHFLPFYFPLDYGWAVRRTLRRVRPAAVVLLELELWPNFLIACGGLGIPVLVANGRVSARSFPRYRRLGALARSLFRAVTAIAAQDQEYARRFEALGVSGERIEVLGNLKYDGEPRPSDPAETLARLGWAGGEGLPPPPVLVAGCTHPGEEEALLESWATLRSDHPALRLVLAPRHIERASEVVALAGSRAGAGNVRTWSEAQGRGAAPPAAPILVVDRIGELDRFYRIADVAFVGGSLIPRGGHNLLEPSRLGRPILFGPWVENFREIADHLLARGAAVQILDAAGLSAEIRRLLADRAAREDLGTRALAAARELGGASARHAAWIRRILGA